MTGQKTVFMAYVESGWCGAVLLTINAYKKIQQNLSFVESLGVNNKQLNAESFYEHRILL